MHIPNQDYRCYDNNRKSVDYNTTFPENKQFIVPIETSV